MKFAQVLLLASTMALPCLTGCAEISDARTEALGNRIDRQDRRIEGRTSRRAMRAEAEDRRYHDWYDRIMGNPQSVW